MTIREIALAILFAGDLIAALGVAGFLLFGVGKRTRQEYRELLPSLAVLFGFFAVANVLFYAGLWLLIR